MPRKSVYLFLAISLLFYSCSILEPGSKDTYSYEFVENSELEITQLDNSYLKYGVISEGSQTVFIYRFDKAQDDNIADDEYTETIRFQIESGIDSFY